MFKTFDDFQTIRYFREDPIIDPNPGGGGGGGADPEPAPAPGNGESPAPKPDEPKPAAYEPPDGQLLISKEDMENFNYYKQYGTPQELYDRHQHYDALINAGQALPKEAEVTPQREQELKQVREVLLEAFPALKTMPDAVAHMTDYMTGMQQNTQQFAKSAMDESLALAETDEIKFETTQDKDMFLQIMANSVKNNPAASARFKAGDSTIIKETYASVVNKFYGKENKPAPPIPRSKLPGKRPIAKGQTTPGGLKDGDVIHDDFNKAGDSAYDRLQESLKE